MTSHESSGALHRMLRSLGGALKRGILGKSAHEYMSQFTGSDKYWERVLAAQQGWPNAASLNQGQLAQQPPVEKPKHVTEALTAQHESVDTKHPRDYTATVSVP
jgi:hypothetical protein